MTRWRYKVEVVRKLRDEGYTGHDTAELEDRLNARVDEGWTVLEILNATTGWLVVYAQERT